MHPVAIAAFTNMTALSTSGHSRPFDVRRDGFVMTEGAAALVLEDWDRAVARGATIYAELAGAASTADAHHITAPSPDGSGAVACMELALADAGILPWPTSGTSTRTAPRPPSTTWPKSRAIAKVFGEPGPARHLHQGGHGTRLGCRRRHRGGGAVLTIHRATIPPTAGYEQPDPEITLNDRARRAAAVGTHGRAVELVRLRRTQRLPGPAPPPPPVERAVALGDSVPYGHGLANPYQTPQIGLPVRAVSQGPSTLAYPSMVAADFGLTMTVRPTNCRLTGDQLSISGAVADGVDNTTRDGQCPIPPQQARNLSDEVAATDLVRHPARLVLLQDGADDIDFSACLENQLARVLGVGIGLGNTCVVNGSVTPTIATQLAQRARRQRTRTPSPRRTTTPSATSHTSAACSGVETPTPTQTGMSV
jgi:hypothetical protein